MEIQSYSFDGEGMSPVYKNSTWMVGIKNWKPANDLGAIDCIERHNLTEELFVLLNGTCTLLYAHEGDEGLRFGTVVMEPFRVYSIPRSMWHNTITTHDTKLILIEDSSTSSENSDVMTLDEQQIAEVKSLFN